MAKPITFQLPRRDPREELRSRLEHAPVEHAEAILAGFEALQGLHDSGALELLRGILGGGSKILEIVVEASKAPEAIRGIRNLLILTKVFGSIDPEVLRKFADAVPDALASAAKAEQTEPPGFWAALTMFRSKNLRRGLALMNNTLEAVTKNFSTENGSSQVERR
jgi:uncharacterized protein YjgD (DUF1641 family)